LNGAVALLGMLFRHAIESRGQLTDLVFGDDFYAGRPVTTGHRTRASRKLRDRPGHALGGPPSKKYTN